MVLITIVTGVYKPTYNWGAPHCTTHYYYWCFCYYGICRLSTVDTYTHWNSYSSALLFLLLLLIIVTSLFVFYSLINGCCLLLLKLVMLLLS